MIWHVTGGLVVRREPFLLAWYAKQKRASATEALRYSLSSALYYLFLNPFFAAITNPTTINTMLPPAKTHLIIVMMVVSQASTEG